MNLFSFISATLDTPWKAWYEIWRIFLHPFAILYLKLNGIKVGKGTRWYGFPKVFRHRHSRIIIGDRVEVRNWRFSNPLGVNHPLILTTWCEGAVIQIDSDVGITGGVICAAKKIRIGDHTLIGANCTIIDTDFHPLSRTNRRYGRENVKIKAVLIGKNCFIGTNSTILKGVTLKDDSIIGAGSVVR